MSISLVSSASAAAANTFSTSAIDTTGATCIIIGVTQAGGGTLSDSKSNTWTGLTIQGTNSTSRLFYCASPTVGSGHTFTMTGSSIFSVLSALAFSGVKASGPFDQESGSQAGPAGAGSAPGSIAASVSNELFVTQYDVERAGAISLTWSGGTSAANFPFTGGVNYGGAMAYKISSGSENPFWNVGGNSRESCVMATFLPAVATGSTQPSVFVIT